MTFHPHFPDSPHVGAIGTGVAATMGLMAKVVELTPELQAISIVISIVAGLLTVVWYVRRFFTGK